MSNTSGPEWRGWESLREPQELKWREVNDEDRRYHECYVGDHILAVLEKRPEYCDRGHWSVKAMIPGLDGADSFPRYYMRSHVAIIETEQWLEWRLWKHY